MNRYDRRCHHRAIKATDVLNVLEEAIKEHGAPEYIRSDNGPEFIATAIQQWLRQRGIKTIYIDPGCPWQNGYVESLNDKFRRECLNRELIYTLSESRVIFADYGIYITMKDRIVLWACSRPKRMPNKLVCLSGSGRAMPTLRQRGKQPQPKPQVNTKNQPLGNLSQ